MDLVLTPKVMCPVCGLHRADEEDKACRECHGIRRNNIEQFLSYIKDYAINMSSVEDIVGHGRNFLGWLKKTDYDRLEALDVEPKDLQDVSYERISVQEYLKKYIQRRGDRWTLLRYILHGLNLRPQYLPIDRDGIKPKKQLDAIRYDSGDEILAKFYLSKNPIDVMETSRQTANKIYFSNRIAVLQKEWDNENSPDILEEATDMFGVALRNNDWWSSEVFAKFFKHVGDLRSHHEAWDLKRRNWTPKPRQVAELTTQINEQHHI